MPDSPRRGSSRAGSAVVWDLVLTCAVSLTGMTAAFGAWRAGPWPAVASLALFAGLLIVRRRLASIFDAADQEARRLRAILGGVSDAVFVSAPDGAGLYYNPAFERLVRARPGSLDRPRLDDFVRTADRGRLAAQLARAGDGSRGEETYAGLRCDGSDVPLICRTSAVSLDSGDASDRIVVATLRDGSNERVVQRGLQAVTQRLEFFFSNMPLGAVIWDRDFAVQEWNEAAVRIFGWKPEEAFGRPYADLLAAEPEDAVETAVRSLGARAGVHIQRGRNRARDGRLLETEWFHTSLADDRGEVVAVASIVVDLTQKLALEERLRQSQKLEAMNVWTAGVAHEFNNLLTAILGNLELLALHGDITGPAAEWLADTQAAAGRARTLTADLVRSSPSRPSVRRPLDIAARLRDQADLFAYALEPGVRFDVRLADDIGLFPADAAQLDRAVEHLLQNAKTAVGAAGSITLSAASVVLDPTFCAARDWARPRRYLLLEVADDGCGIEPAVLPRVFEPFFTTQPVGRGSGLGLAVVRGVAKNHGGGVEIDSAPGQGTRARLYLPQPEAQ